MKKVIIQIILPLFLLVCMIGLALYLVHIRAKPEAKNITSKAPFVETITVQAEVLR